MTQISASDVKELRDITGIGMMDCKKALSAAGGDKDQALKILKEKGLAVAAKRADRETKEGLVIIENQQNAAFMLKLGCETDFVAKNSDFSQLGAKLMQEFVLQGNDYIGSAEQVSLVTEVSGKTGEKMELVDGTSLKSESGFIQHYLHSNQKVGVLVEIKCEPSLASNQDAVEFAKDIAMQIAAMNPIALKIEDISDEEKLEQKEIFLKQMGDLDKPKEILEKIIDGKISKHFSEQCLLDMVFVKDSKLKVKDLQAQVSKKVGSDVSVAQFARMQIGK